METQLTGGRVAVGPGDAPAADTADARAADTADTGAADEHGRRRLAAYVLMTLVPVAVLAALFVLIGMAAGSAAATGGCGGG